MQSTEGEVTGQEAGNEAEDSELRKQQHLSGRRWSASWKPDGSRFVALKR